MTRCLLSRVLALGLAIAARPVPLWAAGAEKLDGYAEWRKGAVLIVDGQRVRAAPRARFKGKGEANDIGSVPMGYEVRAKGSRAPDGTFLAEEIEAEPNEHGLFQSELKEAFDATEDRWRRAGRAFEQDDSGRVSVTYGRLEEGGGEVKRVRRIATRLIPPYLNAEDFRVYVVQNKEWNAFAAPNDSVYVFSGLLRDLDDDEVAIVLGHELTHATHEHSRKEFKKALWIQLAALGVAAVAESMDSNGKRAAVQVATLLGASAWRNGYSRHFEDQADRVGLRYAYEAGYDVKRGPGLWNRFARKYGGGNKAFNFFFGNHAVARDRAANLERELALNYRD